MVKGLGGGWWLVVMVEGESDGEIKMEHLYFEQWLRLLISIKYLI